MQTIVRYNEIICNVIFHVAFYGYDVTPRIKFSKKTWKSFSFMYNWPIKNKNLFLLNSWFSSTCDSIKGHVPCALHKLNVRWEKQLKVKAEPRQ